MTSATEDRAIEILLVEDNPADVRLTEEVLRQSEHTTNITVAEDGVIAMEMLHGTGDYGGTPRPDLILLDLRLPRKDGPEVLAEINSDEGLVNIPVMILTGTEAEQSLLNRIQHPTQPLLPQANRVAAFQQRGGSARNVQPAADKPGPAGGTG